MLKSHACLQIMNKTSAKFQKDWKKIVGVALINTHSIASEMGKNDNPLQWRWGKMTNFTS